MADEISRLRDSSNVMNVLCIGGSYWLQVVVKRDPGVNPFDFHAHFVKEILFPAFKASTNNTTLLSTFLLCAEKILIESSSCKQFFTLVKERLHLYHKIGLFSCVEFLM